MKNEDKDITQCTEPGVAEKLRKLKSLIFHSHEVEEELEIITRSLGEQHIDSINYLLTMSLDVNLKHLQEIFGQSYDVIFRKFNITSLRTAACLVFLNGMVDQNVINGHIIEKLSLPPITGLPLDGEVNHKMEYLEHTLVTASSITKLSNISDAVKSILHGDAVLLVDGIACIIAVSTRKLESRNIAAPETEVEVQGPNDGFIEDIETNITLVRRRIKDPNLIVKKYIVGRRTETDVAVLYYRGITNQTLVREVEKRLQNLKKDVGNPTNVPGLLSDAPYSPFPTVILTERPDKFSMAILKGKVGVMIDGDPFCMIAPANFSDFFRTGEDYSQKTLPAVMIRLLRYAAAFFALTLPALYVALTAYHPALIPTPLTLTLGLAREGIPFPVFLETLLMIFLLEVLQEGGIRIPKTLGPSVSIVGGLVIGDSAVRAGLISPAMVIITAFTALASFCNTNYQMSLAFRFLRILLVSAAGALGMFGFVMGLLLLAAHLTRLESFSEPYLGLLLPQNISNVANLKDSIIIAPPASRQERNLYLEPEDAMNQKTRNKE